MKNFLNILAIFLCFKLSAEAQVEKFNYIVQYKYTFQEDKTDSNSKDYEDMLLLINDKKSVFVSKSAFTMDTLRQRNKNLSLSELLAMRNKFPKNRIKFEVEKSKISNNSYYFEKIFTTTYQTNFKNDALVWKLINEKKNIGGFNCRKAQTALSGRNYTAWYAEEVPISDGPYKFQGLPGLIIEISDSKNEHSFTLRGLEKKSLEYGISHKNVVNANMKEIQDVRTNQLNNIKNSGFTISPELMQAAKEKIAKKNNPIEIIN